MAGADRHSEGADFIPLERLRRSAPARPEMDLELVQALGRRLDEFGEILTSSERAALSAMLQAASPDLPFKALEALPPADVLEPEEIAIVESLLASPVPTTQGLRPSLVMVMKATRRCNLRCTYCRFWSDEPNQLMTFEVLARATHGALTTPGVREAQFVWHGGETTLVPLSFYRKALWLQQRFRRPGQTVLNALQTNGTHLTPEWLEMIQRYRFQVGVSLDGPPEVHDRRRFDVAGRPTSERVRQGIGKLQAHDIQHGILMVVDDEVVAVGAERVLQYLLEIGVTQVALLNVLPDNDLVAPGLESYFEFPRHVEFLRDLFRLWWPAYRERIAFREISDLVNKVQGGDGKMCVFLGNCMGGFLTIEPRGEVGACDKYLGDPEYRFGNVLETPLADLPLSPRFAQVDADTSQGIDHARACPWFQVCQGGCPHDRYLRGRKGISGGEGCCGLSPLLNDIATALGRSPRS